MNIEAKKLELIERFMKLKHEKSIMELEEAITEIEMLARAESSEQDIDNGKYRAYNKFGEEVSQWIKSQITK